MYLPTVSLRLLLCLSPDTLISSLDSKGTHMDDMDRKLIQPSCSPPEVLEGDNIGNCLPWPLQAPWSVALLVYVIHPLRLHARPGWQPGMPLAPSPTSPSQSWLHQHYRETQCKPHVCTPTVNSWILVKSLRRHWTDSRR